MLHEADKCLFVICSLRKEGYAKEEIDHLYNSIVLSKIMYGLPVYAASTLTCDQALPFSQKTPDRRLSAFQILQFYNIFWQDVSRHAIPSSILVHLIS